MPIDLSKIQVEEEPGFLQKWGPPALRLGSGIVASGVGAIPSPITTPAAASIGVLGEAGAQMLEKGTMDPRQLNAPAMLTEGALAAVPGGKIYKSGQLVKSALRGAGFTEGGNIVRKLVERMDPTSTAEVRAEAQSKPLLDKSDITSTLLGAAGGAIASRMGTKVPGKGEAPGRVPPVSAPEVPGKSPTGTAFSPGAPADIPLPASKPTGTGGWSVTPSAPAKAPGFSPERLNEIVSNKLTVSPQEQAALNSALAAEGGKGPLSAIMKAGGQTGKVATAGEKAAQASAAQTALEEAKVGKVSRKGPVVQTTKAVDPETGAAVSQTEAFRPPKKGARTETLKSPLVDTLKAEAQQADQQAQTIAQKLQEAMAGGEQPQLPFGEAPKVETPQAKTPPMERRSPSRAVAPEAGSPEDVERFKQEQIAKRTAEFAAKKPAMASAIPGQAVENLRAKLFPNGAPARNLAAEEAKLTPKVEAAKVEAPPVKEPVIPEASPLSNVVEPKVPALDAESPAIKGQQPPKEIPIFGSQRLGELTTKGTEGTLTAAELAEARALDAKLRGAAEAPVTKAPSAPAQGGVTKMADGLTPEDESLWQKFMSEESGQATPAMAGEIAKRALGGAAGAFTGYETDPLGDPTASAVAGGAAGMYGPDLVSKFVRGKNPMAVAQNVAGRNKLMNTLTSIHNTGLLSPLSLGKKILGDISGAAHAGLEDTIQQALTGEKNYKAGRILSEMTNLPQLTEDFTKGFQAPVNEAATGLEALSQNKYLGGIGRAMQGATIATKQALQRAGLSEDASKLYTMTSNPQTEAGKAAYQLWQKLPGARLVSPFARMGINRLERGFERSPLGLGRLLFTDDPQQKAKIIAQTLTGVGAMGAAHELLPENFMKDHPLEAAMLGALAGPSGVPVLAQMAWDKTSKENPGSTVEEIMLKMPKVAAEISRDIPGLQNLEYIKRSPEEWLRTFLAGFTNVGKPLADYLEPGEVKTQGKELSPTERIFNRTLANIPGVKGTLPPKEGGGGNTGLY